MNHNVLFFSIVLISLFIKSCAPAQSLEERLKSSNQQVRCDAFYELFGIVDGSKNFRTEMLYGKTTKQIHELLGEPTSTYILEYEDTKWLSPHYEFELCPTIASNEFKEAFKKGWRFAPSVIFRNGISVPYSVWSKETRVGNYPIAPEHLRFKKGGAFP